MLAYCGRGSRPSLRRSSVRHTPKGVFLSRVEPVTRHPTPGTFGPEWLRGQLSTLVPEFPNVSLCVALSGGVDSTALLAALAVKRPASLQLRALHVDHGLRAASKQWAAHCRGLARDLHVPFKVLTTKVERPRGTSLEAAARSP